MKIIFSEINKKKVNADYDNQRTNLETDKA